MLPMLTYIPRFAPRGICMTTYNTSYNIANRVLWPRAPRLYTTPLHSPAQLPQLVLSNPTELYPVRLENITIAQEIELDSITLISPVHVHTTSEHIATIRGNFNGEEVSGLDIVLRLQSFSREDINYSIYAQLSSEVQGRAEEAFMQRHGNSMTAALCWTEFVSGMKDRDGLMGSDLLLGYTEIWGVEDGSLPFGNCVVHLA